MNIVVLPSLILWGMLLLASIVFAGMHLARRGVRGIPWALLTVSGAVLLFCFVSVLIGVAERDGFSGEMTFVFLLGGGAGGLAMLVASLVRLFRK